MLKIDRIEHGSIYLSGDKRLVSGERVLEKHIGADGIAFVKATNFEEIFTYGLEQTRGSYFGHKPGYIWASRASVMNAIFDTTLYEAAYREGSSCYCSCAVDLVRIEDLLLEAGYEIDLTPKVSKDGEDVDYQVKEIKEG